MTPEVATEAAGGDDGVRPGRRHHRLGAGRRGSSATATSSPSTWAAPPPRRAWSATASRRMAPGYYVGGYASGHPVMVPMIDVVEVGAGGGIIAWIDEVGALKVGPQSAGADPGPDLLSRRRHRADHHRRQRRARPARSRQLPRRRDEARRRRRARRHRGQDRQAAQAWTTIAAAQAIVEIADQQDVARRARGLGARRATIRATSPWSPPAAPGRCT